MDTEPMSEHQEANKKRLGQLITDGYKAAGDTRRSLAKAVGVSERTMYSLEAGHTAPRELTQRKIEEVLGWARGSIADLLGLGPDADLSEVNLEWMHGPQGAAWPGASAIVGDTVARRLNAATMDAVALLRDSDRKEQDYLRRISELEQQVALLQGGFDLAADGSPNRGRALRDHFDSVEQENQDTA